MSYSTALQVRNILPRLLIAEDIIGEVTAGKYIELNNPAYDVPTVTKDGVELVLDTGFTFVRPYMITLTTAATGENFIAVVYIGASDADLETLVARADRFIDDYFANYSLPGSTYLQDWSSVLAAAFFLRQPGISTEENLKLATELYDQTTSAMKQYTENTAFDTEESHPTKRFVLKVNR